MKFIAALVLSIILTTLHDQVASALVDTPASLYQSPGYDIWMWVVGGMFVVSVIGCLVEAMRR